MQVLTKSNHACQMPGQRTPLAHRLPVQLREFAGFAIGTELPIEFAKLRFDISAQCNDVESRWPDDARAPRRAHRKAAEIVQLRLLLALPQCDGGADQQHQRD